MRHDRSPSDPLAIPSQLIPLISNAELRKRDFHVRTRDRLILGLLWLYPDGLTMEGLVDAALRELDLELTLDQVTGAYERADGAIINVCGTLSLSAAATDGINDEIATFELLERDLAEQFKFDVMQGLLEPGSWINFLDLLVKPMVKTLGIVSFHALYYQKRGITDYRPLIDRYLAQFPAVDHEVIRSRLDKFTRHTNRNFKAFIIAIYGALLALEALGLSEEDARALDGLLDSPGPLKLFVDTNVLFSLLNLRDHHSNEALRRVRRLIDSMAGKREVKLYVTPATITEAREVLANALSDYEKVKIPRSVGQASWDQIREMGTPSFDGLIETFLGSAASVAGRLSANDYFTEKSRNLVLLAKEKGVILYNEDLSRLAESPDTIAQAERMVASDRTARRPRPKTLKRAQFREQLKAEAVRRQAAETKLDALQRDVGRRKAERRYFAITVAGALWAVACIASTFVLTRESYQFIGGAGLLWGFCVWASVVTKASSLSADFSKRGVVRLAVRWRSRAWTFWSGVAASMLATALLSGLPGETIRG